MIYLLPVELILGVAVHLYKSELCALRLASSLFAPVSQLLLNSITVLLTDLQDTISLYGYIIK
jgi:hypothetical protein